jgi:hypothetical protein
MHVLDVLDMAGSTTRSVDAGDFQSLFENLSVVAMPAGCAWIIPVNVGAHITGLVTAVA